MKKLTLLLLLITSFCFAQRKETISGTFFNIYYPNGDHLLNNFATHTISALKGHIEVTVPRGFIMQIYQIRADGNYKEIFINPYGVDGSQDKKYIIKGIYGGPNYEITLSYPEDYLSGLTIVYNIDFYYYDTIYGPDVEPNDTKDTAIAMSENTTYEGWGKSYYGNPDNTFDFYKIVAPKRGTYVITTNGHSTFPELLSLGVNFRGNYKNIDSHYWEGYNTSGPFKVYCVEKGEELFIYTNASFNSSYSIRYTVEETLDENDVEPNDTAEQATAISENTKMKGTIGYGGYGGESNNSSLPKDSKDFYKITPSKNGKLIISFKEKIEVPENFIRVYFKDTKGQLSVLDATELTANNQTFEIDCASPNKTYYIVLNKSNYYISPTQPCNAYEISWNMQDTTNAGCGFLDTADFEFNDSLSIYPNPASDTLQLTDTNNQTINQITITDITGKTIMTPTFDNNTVDIKKLTSGIYFLHATIDDKTITRKFIKK